MLGSLKNSDSYLYCVAVLALRLLMIACYTPTDKGFCVSQAFYKDRTVILMCVQRPRALLETSF